MFLATSVGMKIVQDVEPSKLLQVSLIYANNTEEDILLKDQLDRYAAEHPNFKVGVLMFSSVVILPSFSYWQRDGSSCSGRECADSTGRCLARRGAFCRPNKQIAASQSLVIGEEVVSSLSHRVTAGPSSAVRCSMLWQSPSTRPRGRAALGLSPRSRSSNTCRSQLTTVSSW
jgi:hypothetical protein